MRQKLLARMAAFIGLFFVLAMYFQNCGGFATIGLQPTGTAILASDTTNCTLGSVTVSGIQGNTGQNAITAYPALTSPPGVPCSSTQQVRQCQLGQLSGSYPFTSCTDTPGLPSPSGCSLDGAVVNGDPTSPGVILAYPSSASPAGVLCSANTENRVCTNGTLSGSYPYAHCKNTPAAGCIFNGQPVANGSSVDAWNVSTTIGGAACGAAGVPSAYYISRLCTNGTLSGDPSFAFSSCVPGAAAACVLDGVTIPGTGANNTITAYKPPTGATAYDGTCGAPTTRTCTNGSLSGDASYSLASCPAALGCAVAIKNPNGSLLKTVSGVIDAPTGKCIFPLCGSPNNPALSPDAQISECTTISAAGRPLDGRLPTSPSVSTAGVFANADNLCKKFGADFDYFYIGRVNEIPNCGYNYGLSFPTDAKGDFNWTDLPLCELGQTINNIPPVGVPTIGQVWCVETPAAGTYLPEAIQLPSTNPTSYSPATKGFYNSLPYDQTNVPHYNGDPIFSSQAYCPSGMWSSTDNTCCTSGVDPNSGACFVIENDH